MKKVYYCIYLVCTHLLIISFCTLSEQPITQQLTICVQPGVFPGIEGTYTYNELCQQYQQCVQNNNYGWHQTPTDSYGMRQSMQQATGPYLNINLNGTQMSYGQAAHYNKRNEPWYTDHSRTKPDLSQCSYGQLIVYFVTHNYSEEQILDQYLLYVSDDFVNVAKQIPGYEKKIRVLEHTWTKHKNWLNKVCGYLSGSYIPGLAKRFQKLRRDVDQEKVQKETVARVQREQEACRQKAAEELRIQTVAYCAKIDAVCKNDNDITSIPCDHAQARHTACTQIKTNGILRTTKNYTIDAEIMNFVHAYDMQEHDLATMHGNAYEHQLHTEFLAQLDEVHTICTYHEMSSHNVLIDAVGHSIAIGIQANRLQQPEIATSWANCGWQLLEIIEGIGEGLVQCIQNNVDMVLHPLHTLIHVVHGLKTVTGCCLRAIGTTMRWHEMMERGDGLLMIQEMDNIAAQIVACGTLCAEKLAAMPPGDIAKQATALAADMVLVPKMVSLGSALCVQAAPLIEDAIVVIRDRASRISNAIVRVVETARAESPMVQTTEGMLMRMSEQLEKIGDSAGGAIGEIIKDTRLALEAVHSEYMAKLKAELEPLRLVCDNRVRDVARFGNKYLKADYEHILGIELTSIRNNPISKISGFHHDLMNSLEKTGVIEFANKIVYENGFYKATLYHNGNIVKKTATFFPADWSRRQVIEALYEAYTDFIKSGMKPILEPNGKYRVDAVFNKQVTIRMHITKDAVIKTAYPILE